MAKPRTRYVCQNCGRVAASFLGRCPQCGQYDTYRQEVLNETPARKGARGRRGMSAERPPQPIAQVSSADADRLALQMGEFARVLGGGIVPGSVVLIGGDPGIGKSTLLLQAALDLAARHRVLYVSGEESERQIKMRAERLWADAPLPEQLYLATETNLATIFDHVHQLAPDLLIIDSIQTIYLPEMESSAGSVSQVRECAAQLRELAKSQGLPVFLIGHVTKEGVIAGPRVLEHIVDTVLYLEGDRFQAYRLLRAVKNRFGAASEVGVFEMHERGLREVHNPSEAFLAERMVNAPGSAIAVTMEGARPLLVEVQGLTSQAAYGNARRTTNGIEYNRLLMIAAVLSRRLYLKLGEQDIFVNVVGGLRVAEPAADLAVALAIVSSLQDVPVRADTVVIGEIGLAGELRLPGQMAARLREAEKLGFRTAIVPRRLRRNTPWPTGLDILEVRSLRQAVEAALTKPRPSAKGRKVA